MKYPLGPALAVVLVTVGCTTSIAPTEPTASSTASSAPTSSLSATVPAPTPSSTFLVVPLGRGRSAARVLVSDPDQHSTGLVQKDFGPHGFAVSGDLIVTPNDVRGDVTIYRNGRPVLRKKTGDAYVYDVALRDGLLYVLEGVYVNGDSRTRLRVYAVARGGATLTLKRTRTLALGDNSSEMELDFVGENLIASSLEGESVLAAGPGPLPAPATYDLQKKTASVQTTDGTPSVRFHGHNLLACDVVATDAQWVWYLVEEWTRDGLVYRVPRSGMGEVATYRLHHTVDRGYPRDVAVDDGQVYELIMTSHDAAAQVLLIARSS